MFAINKYTITVLGLGFVGLTTALAFVEKGHKVYGFDINSNRMDVLNQGKLPFVEPGLDDALQRHLNKGFLISNDILCSVVESDFIFICVGTPAGDKGEADLKYIYSAIDMFSAVLDDDKFRVIVIKSTIPPSSTSQKILPYIKAKGLNLEKNVGIANNPEFMREGKCWSDTLNSDRIVCGVNNEITEALLRSLYSRFEAPFFAVSLNTGEFIKYLSNTLLATMISYSNEMSKIADVIGDIQIKEAFNILHLDRRWEDGTMSSYVYPGAGYGGYCLPKDASAMYAESTGKGFEPQILKNVIKTNDSMPMFMLERILKLADSSENIGILGLAFKPGSDDVRESSAAKIIPLLIDRGYKNIYAYDPIATDNFANQYSFEEVTYIKSLSEICDKTNVLVLLTAWEEFKVITEEKYSKKQVIDCRYFL